ncbi:MAG: four helix bundle protein [Patescibacteria group bacterium]
MDSYTQLEAWKVGLDLVAEIHLLTKKFPREELYALTSQARRAATSILLNIAEGFGRYTYPDKAAKYTISRGECHEIEASLFIAIRLQYITSEESQKAFQLIEREQRLLSGLISSCRRRAK